MTRLLASIVLGLAACQPLHAMSMDEAIAEYHEREYAYHEDPGPDDTWFGRIVIFNQDGSSGLPRSFKTKHGLVVLKHVVTQNAPCEQIPPAPRETCADHIEITNLPEGVVPSESSFDMYEETEHTIYLYDNWEGM